MINCKEKSEENEIPCFSIAASGGRSVEILNVIKKAIPNSCIYNFTSMKVQMYADVLKVKINKYYLCRKITTVIRVLYMILN